MFCTNVLWWLRCRPTFKRLHPTSKLHLSIFHIILWNPFPFSFSKRPYYAKPLRCETFHSCLKLQQTFIVRGAAITSSLTSPVKMFKTHSNLLTNVLFWTCLKIFCNHFAMDINTVLCSQKEEFFSVSSSHLVFWEHIFIRELVPSTLMC